MAYNPSALIYRNAVSSGSFTTLAAADAAAVANSGALVIDRNWTLAANTALSAATVIMSGGIITRGAFNLTVSGKFVAEDILQCFDANGTGTVRLPGAPYVSPVWFGAVGDNSTNNAAAFAGVATCVFADTIDITGRQTVKGIVFPPGRYVTNTSWNLTSSTNPFPSLFIRGDNKENTAIYGNLSAAYPIIDMTGNGYGGITGLSIQSLGGSETCALLSAPCSASGGHAGQMLFDQMETNLLVVALGDQPIFRDCYISSIKGDAIACGQGNPYSVTSAYQTIGAPNFTGWTIDSCYLFSSDTTSSVLWFTGGEVCTVRGNTYLASLGANGTRPSIVRVGQAGNTGQANSLIWLGARTENQCAQTGLAVIKTAFSSSAFSTRSGVIYGALTTDSAGAVIDAHNSAGQFLDYNINIDAPAAASALFATNSAVRNVVGFIPSLDVGTLDSANSGNVQLFGLAAGQITTALANNGSVPNLSLSERNSGTLYLPNTAVRVHPKSPTQVCWDEIVYISEAFSAGGSYVGGAALTTIYSWTIPAGAYLRAPGSAQATNAPSTYNKLMGVMQNTAAVNGEIAVQIVQGAFTMNIFDYSSIPAYSATDDGIRLEVDIWDAGSTGVNLYSCTTLWARGQVVSRTFSNIANFNTATAITVNLRVANTGSAPYLFFRNHGKLG